MVVTAHCLSVLPGGENAQWAPLRVIGDGYSGVLIFFVLSGFLITRILLAELRRDNGISLKRFYWHRAVRILPASYSYILICGVLAVIGIAKISMWQILIATFHLWNYKYLLGVDGPDQGAQALGHFWSLALEEQFYWVWPLLLLSIRNSKFRIIFIAAIILAMPIMRIANYVIFPSLREHLRIMFHTGLDPIAMGALLACCEDRARDFIKGASNWVVNTAIFTVFVIGPTMHIVVKGLWLITYGLTIEIVAVSVIIMALIYKPAHWLSALLRRQPFQYVGMISFSLYLWQQMFCILGAPFQLQPYLSVPAALLAASVSFYCIERPASRWRNLISPRRDPLSSSQLPLRADIESTGAGDTKSF